MSCEGWKEELGGCSLDEYGKLVIGLKTSEVIIDYVIHPMPRVNMLISKVVQIQTMSWSPSRMVVGSWLIHQLPSCLPRLQSSGKGRPSPWYNGVPLSSPSLAMWILAALRWHNLNRIKYTYIIKKLLLRFWTMMSHVKVCRSIIK